MLWSSGSDGLNEVVKACVKELISLSKGFPWDLVKDCGDWVAEDGIRGSDVFNAVVGRGLRFGD